MFCKRRLPSTVRPLLLIVTRSTESTVLPGVSPSIPVKNLMISSLLPEVSNVRRVSPLASLLDPPPLIPANITPFHASILFVW